MEGPQPESADPASLSKKILSFIHQLRHGTPPQVVEECPALVPDHLEQVAPQQPRSITGETLVVPKATNGNHQAQDRDECL